MIIVDFVLYFIAVMLGISFSNFNYKKGSSFAQEFEADMNISKEDNPITRFRYFYGYKLKNFYLTISLVLAGVKLIFSYMK